MSSPQDDSASSEDIYIHDDTPVRVTHAEFQQLQQTTRRERRRRQHNDMLAEHSQFPNKPRVQSAAETQAVQALSNEELEARIAAAKSAQSSSVATSDAAATAVQEADDDYDEYATTEITINSDADLRTRQYVIDRQLAPLYAARNYEQMVNALVKANENIVSCGAFNPDSQINISVVSEPRDLHSEERGHITGNTVRDVEGLQVRPALLTRAADALKRAVGWRAAGAAAKVAPTGDDEEDEDEGDEDDTAVGPGGLPLSGSPLRLVTHAPLPVKLTARLLEKSRYAGRIGYDVTSTGRMELSMLAKLTNPTGRGESLEVESKRGVNAEDNTFRMTLGAPDLLTLGSRNNLHVFAHQQLLTHCSATEQVRGARLDWISAGAKHRLAYELTGRELRPVSQRDFSLLDTVQQLPARIGRSVMRTVASGPDGASGSAASHPAKIEPPRFLEPSEHMLALTAPLGPHNHATSVKSAVRYSYTHSSLDDASAPTRGWSLQATAEAAGLGGDAKFVKADATLNKVLPVPIVKNLSIGLGLHGAYLHHLGERARPFLTDRLFLVQNLLLRGHPPGRCGPQSGRDALGGDALVATGVNLAYTMPGSGVQAQVFWNAASIGGVFTSKSSAAAVARSAQFDPATGCLPRTAPFINHLDAFLEGTKQSVGVGVVLPTKVGRIEFNLAKPLFTGEPAKFEFGIGMQWV